jgi:polysaccharide export outer membrane protein
MVQPGDIIHVSSRGVYFVVGEVLRPGIFPISGGLNIGQATAAFGMGIAKNLTMLEALAQAGGLTGIAARSKIRILRTVDGKREEIIVDEVKLYKGEIADPIIHADDIIFVPTSYLRQQTNNLFSTALSGLYAVTQIKSITQ